MAQARRSTRSAQASAPKAATRSNVDGRGLSQAVGNFHADQRPVGWHHWAEVVDRRLRNPRFIGDMPHAWIFSDFIRSALGLLAYERDSDQALVLAAGVLPAWLAQGPVGVAGLGTAHGLLGYQLAQTGGQLRLTLAPGLREPPGGLWLAWRGRLHRVPAGQAGLLLPADAPAPPNAAGSVPRH